MANPDAATVAQLAIRLRLLTEPQLRDGWDELADVPNPSAEQLLRTLERKTHLTPFQTAKLLKGDTDGYFLGGYRLLYRIASGSFGRVFRADNPRTGEIVAIKVLRRRWTEDPRKVALFEREGRVGMSLQHPNLVRILAVSRDAPSGQHFIVMEFVEGGNLRDFLSIRKKISPPEALRLLEETAAGLAYAYSRGLTHRDMKLTNVLISSQGVAKLVDFGLAEITGTAATAVGDDGTDVDRSVDYAGLEKATGTKAGDTRSDIFFLGCVFFEMLTGKPPLNMSKDRHSRMARSRFENLPSLRDAGVEGPPELFQLVDKMLALSPDDRYQTPAQLVEAVRQVRETLEGGGGGASEPRFPSGQRSVFVVESHPRLQEAMRDKFRELGFRVFLSSDPERAVMRYRQGAYHAVVVDVGTADRAGLAASERILDAADGQRLRCGAVVILSENQADWAAELPERANRAVLVRPVTMRQVTERLEELVPAEVQS